MCIYLFYYYYFVYIFYEKYQYFTKFYGIAIKLYTVEIIINILVNTYNIRSRFIYFINCYNDWN